MKSIVFAIFAASKSEFDKSHESLKKVLSDNDDGFLTGPIFHCDSSQHDRLHLLQQNLGRWILFLDADCELTASALEQVKYVIDPKNNYPIRQVWTGAYENPVGHSYLQKVHNLIANSWVRSGFQATNVSDFLEPYLLGGIFLLYTEAEKIQSIVTSHAKWGAEDKVLTRLLINAGYTLQYSDQLKVIHHTTNSWFHFFRRAFLQGFNDPINLNFRSHLHSKIKFWSAELRDQEVTLLPAVLLHFLILATGKLFQQFRRMSRSKR